MQNLPAAAPRYFRWLHSERNGLGYIGVGCVASICRQRIGLTTISQRALFQTQPERLNGAILCQSYFALSPLSMGPGSFAYKSLGPVAKP